MVKCSFFFRLVISLVVLLLSQSSEAGVLVHQSLEKSSTHRLALTGVRKFELAGRKSVLLSNRGPKLRGVLRGLEFL